MQKREEAIKVKQKFLSPLGDHITLLNVFKAFCKAPLKKVSYSLQINYHTAVRSKLIHTSMFICYSNGVKKII